MVYSMQFRATSTPAPKRQGGEARHMASLAYVSSGILSCAKELWRPSMRLRWPADWTIHVSATNGHLEEMGGAFLDVEQEIRLSSMSAQEPSVCPIYTVRPEEPDVGISWRKPTGSGACVNP